ncbi:hypothetical protein NECAME_06615 [Necator americanus]|uniref:Uncharacterized protein n=1 Tax=Necator americanus TaxID=51031 RepID=W2TV01_NECAM|nr:hypothetical protein NECAME_06615 [Necator americanus]ETN84891.1 hypothetical protein NECAME_06615 [Necator americanus]
MRDLYKVIWPAPSKVRIFLPDAVRVGNLDNDPQEIPYPFLKLLFRIEPKKLRQNLSSRPRAVVK